MQLLICKNIRFPFLRKRDYIIDILLELFSNVGMSDQWPLIVQTIIRGSQVFHRLLVPLVVLLIQIIINKTTVNEMLYPSKQYSSKYRLESLFIACPSPPTTPKGSATLWRFYQRFSTGLICRFPSSIKSSRGVAL